MLNLEAGGGDLSILRDLFESDLERDRWLPAGHDYRSRAYQCFFVDRKRSRLEFVTEPPPYVQAADINPVAGGLKRTFRTLPDTHPVTEIARRLANSFIALLLSGGIVSRAGESLMLDVHYIRISAPGKPCPEGVHRDGLIAGSVHLVGLQNVRGGQTHFTDDAGRSCRSLRLDRFLDSVVFDDRRLLHYTDDISRIDPNTDGHRDVLLLGLRKRS